MTIIQPNRENSIFGILTLFVTVGVIGVSLWGIMLYNEVVSARHDFEKQETAFRTIEVENGELKNTVYTMSDQKNIERIANARTLILEKNPQYIKSGHIAEER